MQKKDSWGKCKLHSGDGELSRFWRQSQLREREPDQDHKVFHTYDMSP